MKRPNKNTPLNFTEVYKSRISLIVSVVVMLLLCLFLGQLDRILIKAPQQKQAEEQKKQEEQEQLAQEQPDVYTANIVAVGDNRFSSSLIDSGYQDSDGSYSFDSIYSQVRSEISGADLALVNQETVFTENSDSYSGEDTFASPTAVGDALVNAGFNVIASATDHIDDFGSSMINETLNYWSTSHPDVHLLGIHASETDAGTITVAEVNQIKIALLDYTASSYTAQLDSSESYLVDQLDQAKVSADIAAAKEVSDCIIVCANWGDGDATEVDSTQRDWANFLLSQGVLVTIGVNPREVQPFETLTDAAGNSMLVYYSLGNFVSTQNQIPRLLEGMAKFTIQKTVPKDPAQATEVTVTASSLEPMVMHYNYNDNSYGVYMLSQYTDDLAASHSIHDSTDEEFTVSSLQALFQERTGVSVAGSSQSGQPSSGEGALDSSGGTTGTGDSSADGSSSGDGSDSSDSSDSSYGSDSSGDSDSSDTDDGSDSAGSSSDDGSGDGSDSSGSGSDDSSGAGTDDGSDSGDDGSDSDADDFLYY